MSDVKIGTRGSALALWQARHVQSRLGAAGIACELEIIKTSGDKNTERPLSEIGAAAGGKGLFVKEIEEALLDHRISIAVHSGKDLPSSVTKGLAIAAFLEREDPRDALLSKDGLRLDALPQGARLGTSSLRRASQALAARPDLQILDLRGNVDTRVRKLDEGKYDAIVLALAGLKRMGLADRVTHPIETGVMLPAVAQGAMAVETRADDPLRGKIAEVLDHAATRAAVTAERAFLARLEGGCQLPVAGHARVEGNEIVLEGLIAAPPAPGTATRVLRRTARGTDAERLGRDLAESLLFSGGRDILASVKPMPPGGAA